MKQSNIFNEFLEKPGTSIKKLSKDSETKLADIIQKEPHTDVDIGIIGVPFDKGVEISGGRIGARKAPDAIRKQLSKYGTTFDIDYEIDFSSLKITDFGNMVVTNNQKETYRRIHDVVSEILKLDVFPIVLGGGHDITYPCIHAFADHYKKIGGINFDAHYDVREPVNNRISSGMPFRKILDDIDGKPLSGKNFVEFGVDGNVNSKKYFNYLKKRNVLIYPLKKIRNESRNKGIESVLSKALTNAEENTNAVFSSIDIDGVSAAYAPGCSCINPNGFTADEISRIAYTLGLNKNIKYFDIVETNPEYDIDNRTTRLCAKLLGSFLSGYKQRN